MEEADFNEFIRAHIPLLIYANWHKKQTYAATRTLLDSE